MLAFAVGAAFDWFWEIAGLGAVFFLAGGVVVAARCAQLAAEPRPSGTEDAEGRRYGLAVAGLAVAWIAAIALVGPLLVDREIDASRAPRRPAGDFGSARSTMPKRARSIEPWAASPYVQLGLLAELQGDYPTAIATSATRSSARTTTGSGTTCAPRSSTRPATKAAAQADLERARQLNPLRQLPARRDGTAGERDDAEARQDAAPSGLPAAGGAPRRRAPRPRWRTGSGLTGPSGSRRRGALLRRLLGAGRLGWR